LREKRKGGEGGTPGVFIGGLFHAGGARVRAGEGDRRRRRSWAHHGLCPGKKEGLTGGATRSARGKERGHTTSGFCPAGPWAGLGNGPNRSPEPFSYFLYFFSFFFSDFCFISYLLQKCVKSIQIKS
jgi:hypothetical protein